MNNLPFDEIMRLYHLCRHDDMKITLFYFACIYKFDDCVNKGTLKHGKLAKKHNSLLFDDRKRLEELLDICGKCRDNFVHDLKSSKDYSYYEYHDNNILIRRNTIDDIDVIINKWQT